MKSLLYILVIVSSLSFTKLHGQTYLHATVGQQNTYSGGCPVATCSGNYYDDGGAGSNYSNNVNNIYQIFCPNSAGTCLRLTFNAFDLESYSAFWGWGEYLTIGNGPAQNSTLFTTAPANGSGIITGTPTVPFSYTANNSSGCLTVRFRSDGSTRRPGWSASISCVPCAVRQADGNSDCTAPTQICSNGSFAGSSPGPGSNAADGCTGCVTGETYSNWYIFSPQTSGSLSLAISPNVGTDDLDFALYGPGASCGSLGSPIRCSYAAGTGATGMGNGAVDNSEDVNGNSWVAPVNVVAGQIYFLMINNWTAGGAGYNVSFAGSTASLDCTPLSVELTSFSGVSYETYNTLSWKAEASGNVDYYTLERSTDAENWDFVSEQSNSKLTDFKVSYSVNDEQFIPGEVNYYRLSRTNFNKETTHIRTISLLNKNEPVRILKIVNMLGQEVDPNYEGMRIIMYSNGTSLKKVGK